jgi:hypothetical protein
MRPTLTSEMARVITADRIEAAEHFRRSRQARDSSAAAADVYDSVTVRLAGEHDQPAQRPRRFAGARALAQRLARSYS